MTSAHPTMRTTPLAFALFLTTLAPSLTKTARADPGDAGNVWAEPAVEPIPAHDARHQGIVLDGWLGGGVTSVVKEDGATGTGGLGLTGLYYYRWFEVGFAYNVQVGQFISQVPGVLVGVKLDPVRWFRLDLLGEGGADIVSGVGSGLFQTIESGGQATLPYLGGRAGASFLLGRAHRFVLGWWVNAGEAVGQVIVQSVVQSCLLGCSTENDTFTFGGTSWSMGLRIGGEIAQW
jgi:hypothetical protein